MAADAFYVLSIFAVLVLAAVTAARARATTASPVAQGALLGVSWTAAALAAVLLVSLARVLS